MSNWQVGFYLFLFRLFSSLVPRRLHPFFTTVGNHLIFPLTKQTRECVKENLRVIVKGQYSEKKINKLAKRCFQNYSQKLLDYMSMHRLDVSNRWKLVEREVGEEHLARALKRGKGVICVTPHLGNWELGGYVLASKGYPVNILTLKEGSRSLRKYEEKVRLQFGIHTIYIDPFQESNLAIVEIARKLRENQIVALIADRIVGDRWVEVQFFGRPTKFPVGPALLAMETGASVIPVFVVLEKRMKYWGILEKPILFTNSAQGKGESLRQGMEKIAESFERMISRYPDQWYNFFSYWG
ncbi:MAG: lysophospholipid acyltransferase family protein [Syntrophobacterales bacterium]|nr:MAG: lysophospholipid acyltransferase family protein [Syntrophobacterales bacterium]